MVDFIAEHSIEFEYVGKNKKITSEDLGLIKAPIYTYKVGDVINFVSVMSEDEKKYMSMVVTAIKSEVHDNFINEQVQVVSVKEN